MVCCGLLWFAVVSYGLLWLGIFLLLLLLLLLVRFCFSRPSEEEEDSIGRVYLQIRLGQERAAADRYDVIVLDRMLPQLDGLGVVSLMRKDGVSTPVLFLTNLSGVDDRVDGFDAGGDDYLVKPSRS